MNRDAAIANLRSVMLKATPALEGYVAAHGYKARRYPRDSKEPRRKEKQMLQDRMTDLFARGFRRQMREVRERIRNAYPDRKEIAIVAGELSEDDNFIAELYRLILMGVQGGLELFDEMVGMGLDYTLTNIEAANWALRYAGELVKDIDNTTRDAIGRAVQQFVNTPGMTIGDIVDMLPFGEDRALRVAVTETTRSYANGQMMAGETLKKQYPDVRVVKKWYTNQDDRVCPICGPLGDGDYIDLDEQFGGMYSEPPAHPNCRCWISTRTMING